MPNDTPMTATSRLNSGAKTRVDLTLTALNVSIAPFQKNARSTRPVSGSVHPILVAVTGAARWGCTFACVSPPSPATASNITSPDNIHAVTTARTTMAEASAGTNVASDVAKGGRTIAMNGQSTTCGQPEDVTRAISTKTSG